MFNFLKKYVPHTPKKRGLYAFTKYRRGDFLLFIKKEDKNTFEFMQLPSCEQVYLSADDFNNSIVSKLLEFVNLIPADVFDVCVVNIKKP